MRFFAEAVDDLFVLLRAERRRDEGLRFAAGEEGRAVGAREHALTDFDRTDRARVAAVDAGFAVQNVRAHELPFKFEEDVVHLVRVGRLRAGSGRIRGELGVDAVVDRAKLLHAGLLRADRIGFVKSSVGEFDDAGDERFIRSGRLPVPGGLAAFGDEFVDRLDDDLHFAVAEHHGFKHRLFGEDVGFRFNHKDGALRAGHDEVETRVLELFGGRVENEAVVDVADAAGADRSAEGNAGNGERGRGADHRRNVRIHGGVGREDVNDDLNFVVEAVREERTDRAVDETRGERFLLGGTPFTLEEAARDLARGIGLFDVVDREREEVLAGLRLLLRDDRGENDRVVHAADAGAGGLTGNFPRFERDVVVAETEALRDLVEHRHGAVSFREKCRFFLMLASRGVRRCLQIFDNARCGRKALEDFQKASDRNALCGSESRAGGTETAGFT